MRLIFILLFVCGTAIYCCGQLSLSDTIHNRVIKEEHPDKITGYFADGSKQYEGYKNKNNLYGLWNSWYSNGQTLDSGILQKGIPGGTWVMRFNNGLPQFIRTYSTEKWEQFQNEKIRYHSKRISMPLTKLFHEDKIKAEQYITAINTFCDKQNCSRPDKEDISVRVNANSKDHHYHPLFENGLLHGPFINYFPDGAVKDSGNYRDGLPEGLWIKWTGDKQFYWEGYYQHGAKNKEWKLYSANRRLVRVVSYRQGKIIWRKDMKDVVGVKVED